MPVLAPQENLMIKPTKLESTKRKVVTEISKKMAEGNTNTLLAEADSLSSYSRKRSAMSFETPKNPNKKITHQVMKTSCGHMKMLNSC